ncbi:MAG: transcription elongation factor GreA [Pirellulaceae bacterium]
MTESVPMTKENYDKLKDEVRRLETVEMPKIAEKIAEARAEGDLKENAEYHGQREAQGLLQAKINMLSQKLANATIVDMTKIKHDEVGFGATVLVKDLDIDDEEEITLVGAGDENYDAGKYNIASPIGQGLLGKRVGDTTEIEVPKGVIRFEVVEIRYE